MKDLANQLDGLCSRKERIQYLQSRAGLDDTIEELITQGIVKPRPVLPPEPDTEGGIPYPPKPEEPPMPCKPDAPQKPSCKHDDDLSFRNFILPIIVIFAMFFLKSSLGRISRSLDDALDSIICIAGGIMIAAVFIRHNSKQKEVDKVNSKILGAYDLAKKAWESQCREMDSNWERECNILRSKWQDECDAIDEDWEKTCDDLKGKWHKESDDIIKERQEAKLKQARKELEEYPYKDIVSGKYASIDNIKKLMNVINDGRADSIKEAINCVIEDEHRREVELEACQQREAAEMAAEEARRAAEEARRRKDAEEDARVEKCWSCKNSRDCRIYCTSAARV